MLDQNLLNYVKNALDQGHNTTDIRQVLLTSGWNSGDVDQAISLLQGSKPPTAAPVPTPTPTITPGFVPSTTHTYNRQPFQPSYVSVYSQLLAVVLFFFLLILVNRIIYDINKHFTDINSRLIFDAILIVPFLLAATALHLTFKDRQEKYLVLSYPYYIVSGWLILRLLWYVSAYILSTNATYGVYIVLIMVITVLTGIVFFIQKFMRKAN